MSEAKHTPGPRRAIRGTDSTFRAHERPGSGFVLAADNETVVGRFPKYADAVLDAAAPEMNTALAAAPRPYSQAFHGYNLDAWLAVYFLWFTNDRADAIAKATGATS